jgi:phenylacetate-CoA ligase
LSVIDILYKKSPVWMQNFGISLYGLYWNFRRYSGIFESELRGFKERESFSGQQWNEYQTLKLRALLLHAFDTVPLYNEKYKKSGFKRSDFEKFELEDMQKLPFLEKEELRQFGTTSLLSGKKEKGGVYYSSSGSTGSPVQILFSRLMHQRVHAAYEARVRNWAGVDRFMSKGMIGGRRVVPDGEATPPYYRYNMAEKQLYMSAYHIGPDTVENYANGIKKYNIEYMTGYAQSNYFLARFFREKGVRIYGVKAVITSSEKLTQEMREVFRAVYGCNVYDGYSGVENCGLISETEYGQMLVSPDVGILEVLNDDMENVKPGEVGEVVSTGFLNFDQPLIRYRIGDMVKLHRNQNTLCGMQMPVIEEIIGRTEDVVIGKDGRHMVRFHGIFVNLSNIIEGQIIQENYEKFIVKVVSEKKLSDNDVVTIGTRMKSQLGNIDLKVVRVHRIPRTRNGKFQAVISKIK